MGRIGALDDDADDDDASFSAIDFDDFDLHLLWVFHKNRIEKKTIITFLACAFFLSLYADQL